MSSKVRNLNSLPYPGYHASSATLGKALAGHFLEADADKMSAKSMEKHESTYGNPLTDYMRLLVAETKSRGPINLAEAVRRQKETWAKWEKRRQEREAQDAANESVADLPLFAG